ncbi:hypothetical protein EJ05DRAFT_539916 [Pseudovirgaria hyperparasitica]|uniref:Cell wall protein n=1 Tax=Pseudovirgaria hyperparasitica TaxID=470096 RepID=A0A6A6W0S5_9PEZI|nr:uncharacterized protein EJ05DRAFT_539916 [Pseudovirgaria hyperparasitica]KAF2756115.1 hypothetical protein EJ05DRAFT_539916 [Pseudovirgaria hyperparasitica]
MITIDQGFTLLDQVNALNDAAAKAVQDATDKKPTLVSACVGPTVLAALQDQLAAAKAFQASVANRFNEGEERDLALQLSQPAIDSLQTGVNNFSDQTSLPAGCAEPTPSGTPEPTPEPTSEPTPEPTPSETSSEAPSGTPSPEPTPSGSPSPSGSSSSEIPTPTGGNPHPTGGAPGTSGGSPPTGGNPHPTGGAPGTSGGSVPSQTGGHGVPTPTKPSGPGFTGPVFTGAAVPMGVANVGAFAAAAFAAVAAF